MSRKLVYIGLTGFTASIMCVAAQARFYLGPVPYTMQNLGVVLAGLLLPPLYALSSQLLYLLLIALGLPVAAGFRGGLNVLFGYTAGYLWGFPIASLLVSVVSRIYLKTVGRKLSSMCSRDIVVLWLLSSLATIPVYVLGYLVFLYYAIPGSRLYSWAENVVKNMGLSLTDPLTVLFIASVLVFIPQDILMDHLIAVYVSRSIARILEFRGAALE